MRTFGRVLAVSTVCVGMLHASAISEPAVRIPELRAAALSGETVTLPDAFRGKVGVLVIGFGQSSRGEVTEWARRLAGGYGASAQVTYYEMAVLASVPRLLRGFVSGKIKESVPAPAQARFLLIEADEPAWKRVAGYRAADRAYVLVVDGRGMVSWQFEGAATDDAFAALRSRIDSLHPSR